jgi:hypothetical protein
MAVFFNGRLLTTPTTASAVDDSALANQSIATGNAVAILGPSAGGQPNVPLVFGSPTDAENTLISGDLLTAVKNAFSPSNQTGGPASVTAIRVNPALQSSVALLDSTAAPAINLTSDDFGQYTDGINVSIAAGSISGILATVALGQNFYTQDNITRTMLQVQYSGPQASATMSINGTTLTLNAPTGTPVATIALSTYPTVQALVGAISAVSGFTASVQGGNGALGTVNAFDFVTAVNVKTAPYSAMAVLQAVIDWFNSNAQPLVSASRATNAGLVPAAVNTAFLSGGTDGTITNTNWSNAYSALEAVDVQWVTCATPLAAIHAMNDAHCQFMSTVGSSERRGVVGMALGTTDAQALAEALSLNSDRTGLVHIGYNDFDDNNNLVLFGAYLLAAKVVGGFAGLSPGQAMTNKSLNANSLERVLQIPTQSDPLINGGVMPIESTTTGIKVVKSISTWLSNENFDKVELSTGAALDFTSRTVRAALDPLRGQGNGPIVLAQAASLTSTALTKLAVPPPTGPGVIVGDVASGSPAFKNITATASGDSIAVQFQCSPVIPLNYITVTIFAVPFSGSISV